MLNCTKSLNIVLYKIIQKVNILGLTLTYSYYIYNYCLSYWFNLSLSFFFLLILSTKISIETFLHTLVYDLAYTLVYVFVYTIANFFILFHTCPFYTSLKLFYSCLYLPMYTSLCIIVYKYLSLCACQYLLA